MNLILINELDNRLLFRKQIDFKLMHQQMPTPTRIEVKNKLAAQFNANPNAVIVHQMKTRFGQGITTGFAKIYDSPEKAQEIEAKYQLKRNQPQAKETPSK